ncbi:hypothetical protein HMPREF9171_1555 [Streptococcus agalactiae ATCC 13813]|nr:hypothetical protein HMPREF9171_1555 [Streptococcus agalactiae ATCC 13813]
MVVSFGNVFKKLTLLGEINVDTLKFCYNKGIEILKYSIE